MNEATDILTQLTLLQKAALLSGENTWQTRSIPALGIPPIWMADGPHGVRKQVGSADHLGINDSEPATCFPTAATVANSWDESLAEEVGAALGREASAQGVHVLLGPGLNIKRSPLGGRNFEYFSEDPELAGRLAAAYVRGIQSEGVAATPKHFAVNSQELRRMVSDSIVDERTLRELYLTAFEIVVRESAPWAIMSSYNLVNGEYAHENMHLLQRILRGEWGFDGAVISDWGGSNDAVAAVRAGGTIEMPSPGFDSARAILDAIRAGDLSENDVDARALELLTLVKRVTRNAPTVDVDLDAHHALARRAAAESVVLLQNRDRLLPLAPGSKVALVGAFASEPRYQGAGSSLVNPHRLTTLVDALPAAGIAVTEFAQGYRRDGSAAPDLVQRAVAAAANAEVVVLALGLPETAESEGLDRSDYGLPDDQIDLLRAVHAVNPRVVVVLSAGGPVATPWLDSSPALVHAYLGGQAGAEALADVLTGAVHPSGRLAESFPLGIEDTPTAGRFPSFDRTAEYREAVFVGYRYYETAHVPVAFPFGFGLGYTDFGFSALRVSSDQATVTVENIGDTTGTSVVQVYVGQPEGRDALRPRRTLAGFAKVELEPGESRTVTVPLSERAFRTFDVEREAWQTVAGEYEISVGWNARDIALSAPVDVDGVPPASASDMDTYRHADIRGVSDEEFAALLRRPVPVSAWGDETLGFNDPIDRIRIARSGIARLAFRILDHRRRKAEASGHPDLNILFMFNAPFRVLSKMSGGRASRELTDAVLTLVNGRLLRGLVDIVTAYVRGRRLEKRSRKSFRADAGNTERGR